MPNNKMKIQLVPPSLTDGPGKSALKHIVDEVNKAQTHPIDCTIVNYPPSWIGTPDGRPELPDPEFSFIETEPSPIWTLLRRWVVDNASEEDPSSVIAVRRTDGALEYQFPSEEAMLETLQNLRDAGYTICEEAPHPKKEENEDDPR